MSATALRPLCAGRVVRRRVIEFSPLPSGRYLFQVLEGQPLRVTQEMELKQPPQSRAELIALAEMAG